MSEDELARIRRWNSRISEHESNGLSFSEAVDRIAEESTVRLPKVLDCGPDVFRSPAERIGISRYTSERSYYDTIPASDISVYGWLTINCRPDVDERKFLKSTNKFIQNTKLFEWYVYNFEQRSEDLGTYHGPHCHLLFKRVDKPGTTVTQLKKTFKRFCNVDNHKTFHLVWIDHSDVPCKFTYIKGDKHGDHAESKLRKVIVDIEWRKLNLVDPYYQSWVENDEAVPIDLVGTAEVLPPVDSDSD